MRKLLLLLSILLSSLSVAQDLYWPATLGEINTGANLTMLITLEEELSLNGNPVSDGALIGIFYEDVILVSSLSMAFLMICAQIAHIKARNPLMKYVPSFILLLLSLLVAGVNYGII